MNKFNDNMSSFNCNHNVNEIRCTPNSCQNMVMFMKAILTYPAMVQHRGTDYSLLTLRDMLCTAAEHAERAKGLL